VIRFFIVGTGRCGTELVRNILNSHPDVYVPGESHWIPSQYDAYGALQNRSAMYFDIVRRTFYHTGQPTIDRITEELTLTSEDFLQRVQDKLPTSNPTVAEFNDVLFRMAGEHVGRSIVGDKTPDYGSYLRLLHSLWPKAVFLHLIRDGRDAAVSMSQHGGFQRLLSCRIPNWVPLSLDKRYEIVYNSDSNHSIQDYLELWSLRVRRTIEEASHLPQGAYTEVRYEELLRDPNVTLRTIMEFFQIESSEEWRSAAIRLIRARNTGKFRAFAQPVTLSAFARDTLAALGYGTEFA
jgi:hypothetical protein